MGVGVGWRMGGFERRLWGGYLVSANYQDGVGSSGRWISLKEA